MTELLERAILPPTSPHAIHPGFLNAVYLTACSVGEGVLLQHVEHFLKETQAQLRQSLTLVDRITHFLWGSILLSTWFARAGRFLETYVSMVSTVRFALGCGLVGSEAGVLPPLSNADEAIDRIYVSSESRTRAPKIIDLLTQCYSFSTRFTTWIGQFPCTPTSEAH